MPSGPVVAANLSAFNPQLSTLNRGSIVTHYPGLLLHAKKRRRVAGCLKARLGVATSCAEMTSSERKRNEVTLAVSIRTWVVGATVPGNGASTSNARQRLNAWIAPGLSQQLPECHALRVIEFQHPGRYLADFTQRFNPAFAQVKVLLPTVRSRIVEPNQTARAEAYGAKISPLVPITVETGVSEVVLRRRAAVFDAEDVVHFTAMISIRIVDKAILT